MLKIRFEGETYLIIVYKKESEIEMCVLEWKGLKMECCFGLQEV